MLSKSKINYLKSLHKKKYRSIENKFLLEGFRLIDQAISTDIIIENIWITEKSKNSLLGKELFNKFNKNIFSISYISEKNINQICDSINNQGIIALSKIPSYKKYNLVPLKSIYLDNISDPGNMGTILRTAAWFGIKSIFFSFGCVDPFNSKVLRSAMGAHFYFTNFEKINNVNNFFMDLKKNKVEILGSKIKGDSIEKLDISDSFGWCLILGSESHGISKSLTNYLSKIITIPGKNSLESLNVSVASGIILNKLISLDLVTN